MLVVLSDLFGGDESQVKWWKCGQGFEGSSSVLLLFARVSPLPCD